MIKKKKKMIFVLLNKNVMYNIIYVLYYVNHAIPRTC